MTDRTGSTDRAMDTALDLDHLGRMTHCDRELEREVLELFDRQAAMMADRLRSATAEVAVSCAHTLKGSARGIGAWRLARAAEQVERVAAASAPDVAAAVAQLLGAVDEARSAIARRLIS
jgi:HPt (histidine-containing phosphotransfer) domain-containing protein